MGAVGRVEGVMVGCVGWNDTVGLMDTLGLAVGRVGLKDVEGRNEVDGMELTVGLAEGWMVGQRVGFPGSGVGLNVVGLPVAL